jgi:hypothetical protein
MNWYLIRMTFLGQPIEKMFYGEREIAAAIALSAQMAPAQFGSLSIFEWSATGWQTVSPLSLLGSMPGLPIPGISLPWQQS